MKNWMVMFIFFDFDQKYPFLRNLFQQSKIVCCSLNLELRLIRICRIRWWFSFLLLLLLVFLIRNTLFWVNFVQKFKIVRLSWNLVPRLIRISKTQWWCSAFYLKPFLKVLPKKFIWHFDVTWLTTQQFTQRDLKPAAFLISIKSWKILKSVTILSGTCPSFWFLWYINLGLQ